MEKKGISRMNQNEFDNFSELLVSVADYYGKSLKPAAIQFYWNALSALDFDTVQNLVNEHVKTKEFMPKISELLDTVRNLDGRPSPEEAWSMVARSLNDEGATIVWTYEMAAAFGVALGLQDDRIGARMAFKEAYAGAVRAARKEGRWVRWTPSLGHDVNGREGPLLEAAKLGRLTVNHVRGLLPYRDVNHDVAKLIEQKTPQITKHDEQLST